MKKKDFNRGWTVQKQGENQRRKIHLPHDAMLYEKRFPKAKSGSAGAFFEGGAYIYEKDWELTEEQVRQTFILEFEGVYQNAKVLLNGEAVCSCPYGYTNFFADMSGKLKAGSNRLTVIADNSGQPGSRWYSGSGIYREVYLYEAGRYYICPEGIRVRTIGENKIHVSVETVSDNRCHVQLEIRQDGVLIAEAAGTECDIEIENPQLWNERNPQLYTCRALLYREGMLLDQADVQFGIRTLFWGAQGFLLNGEPILLRGACVHHDNGILGACSFRDAEYRKVRILKEAGFNAIRSAHNPISKAMLEACDEMGMYVMDEAFDMWLEHKNPHDYGGAVFREWWKKDLSAMICKDYNHPSVVMYSIGNEISELGREDGQKQAKEMVAFCHMLDASRPVTAGINLALANMAKNSKSLYPDADKEVEEGRDDTANVPTSEFFNMLMNKMEGTMDMAASKKGCNEIAVILREIFDIPGYNYATSRYVRDAEEAPGQAMVGAETMPGNLYRNWQLVKRFPTLIGDFMWTGYDYLGEAGIGVIRYLDKKTKKDVDEGLLITGGPGVIDICGKKRPETGWNKSIWGLTDQPTIGVLPYNHVKQTKIGRVWRKRDTVESWSWEGFEGERSDIVVYAAAARVELRVNQKSMGKRRTKENTAVFRRIPYVPGQIEAISYDAQGREISRSKLHTATGKTQILLTPESTQLTANGQSLCFLNIDLAGENGLTKATEDKRLKVEVEGAGSLQAFGSARPNMAEDFVSDTHTTYYGKALAIIRAGYEPGEITVRVSGENLEPQELKIEVKD